MRADALAAWRAALLVTVLAGAGLPPAVQAQASRAELEQRLERLERMADNPALLELARQVEQLNAEVRSLRGGLEELQFALDGAKEQQRAQYLDLDQRLQAVETRASELAVAAAADPGAEYQAAFELLKAGRYDEARLGFESFLAAHSGHELAANAQYWLGEIAYVERDYEKALAAFGKVLDGYPGARKAPDARLKTGYCHYELKRFDRARAALRAVVSDYPGTPAAADAAQRLAKMDAAGQ
jgi:tol-pal system protein YbgF